MKYDIHITRAAERDLNSAADYIEFVLLNPQAADDLLDEAENKIGDLSAFPEKFALGDDLFFPEEKWTDYRCPFLDKQWSQKYTLRSRKP